MPAVTPIWRRPTRCCAAMNRQQKRSGEAKLYSSRKRPSLLLIFTPKKPRCEVAQVNLGYTRILAPADGTVGERQVRPGQLVSPGTQVMTLCGKHTVGSSKFPRDTADQHQSRRSVAEIRVDVYPGQVFKGRVLEIAPASGSQFALLPPDNATGNFTKVVQRVPVKIALDDSALTRELRPGLSAVVTVRTRH